MTEEVAIRIAEALESIRSSIVSMETLVFTLAIVFGVVSFIYIITKD